MSPRQLVIHIGAHKCGSSSFQELLTAESAALRSKGVRYMEAGRRNRTNHHRLVRALSAIRPAPRPVRKRILAEFWEEIRSSEQEQLVISSEAFAHLRPEDNIAIFQEIRQERIHIHTLFFAREHVSLFNSIYVELVRSFQVLQSIEDCFDARSTHFSQRFSRVLRRWERWSDEVTVLEFSAQQMEQFFLTQWDHQVTLPHSRPGLSATQVEAALLYASYFASLSPTGSVVVADHFDFLDRLGEAAALSQPTEGSYWGITPALQEKLIVCTQEDRAFCLSQYGVDLQQPKQKPLNTTTRPFTDEARNEIETLIADFVPKDYVQSYLARST